MLGKMYPTVLKVKAYSLKLSMNTSIRRERITYNLHCMICLQYSQMPILYRTSPKILSIIAQTPTQII